MQLTFEPARLTRFAILAVAGAAVLSVGACSSSHDEKSSPTSSSPAASKGEEKDAVQGLLASRSGKLVQVTQGTSTATVDVSPSAKIFEYTNAQLSDFAAGNCVRTNFKPGANGGPGTAITLQLNPGGDKCPQPKTVASGSPGALLPAGDVQAVIGTVASVAGNTINVAVTDANGNPSQTELTVTDQTRYTKGTPALFQAMAQGKCINAMGTKDGGGTLQATRVILTPANNGKCAGK
jgi:hypothetical protein